jgi:hypothetical protein
VLVQEEKLNLVFNTKSIQRPSITDWREKLTKTVFDSRSIVAHANNPALSTSETETDRWIFSIIWTGQCRSDDPFAGSIASYEEPSQHFEQSNLSQPQ